MELPSRSIFTFCDPWGLWHVVHSSFPSRTGMCEERWTLATSRLWHCTHVSVTVAFLSWASTDLGSWTLWQVVHDMLRESCLLPAQLVCSERAWQVTQISPTRRGLIFEGFRMFPSPSASTCALPGPWQVSHEFFAAGVRWFFG